MAGYRFLQLFSNNSASSRVELDTDGENIIMSAKWEKEDNGEYALVFGDFDKGIAPSPHKGVANMQAVNLSTEEGEVMCSYSRILQSTPVNTATGIIDAVDSTHVLFTGITVYAGIWINISASTITGLSTGNYYVFPNGQISSFYNGTITSGLGVTGTATFTILRNMGEPIAKATEEYSDSINIRYRYYILDANGLVWVLDTLLFDLSGIGWQLPDPTLSWWVTGSGPSGLAVLDGWLLAFAGNTIYAKSTVNLGATVGSTSGLSSAWTILGNPILMDIPSTPNTHFALTSHQASKVYYTDGNYIGFLQATNAFVGTTPTGVANIQSFSKYTSTTTIGTILNVISGSIPSTGVNIGGPGYSRIPAVFFALQAGELATALTPGTVYWIAYGLGSIQTFQVFAAQNGGSALDITTNAVGPQYFNTFYPIGNDAGPGETDALAIFNPTAMQLPPFEIAQSLVEVGNTIIVGGITNTLYPWNQVDPSFSDLIALPESNVKAMINVNNMVYILAGFKGNVYITNNSVASLVTTIPDYCAGIAGTPSSYIEPYFYWQDIMYVRGRVYVSVLDQTAVKAGNCGGIWSFIPTQNFYVGQDVGVSMRLENQNSYGNYSGAATLLLPSQEQNATGPQYWSGWKNSYDVTHSTLYGIDATSAVPATTALIETDVVATGSLLKKDSFEQVEYKLAAPLTTGDSVSISYRLNLTDAYTSCGSVVQEGITPFSGYFVANFQNTQWVQFQIALIPNGLSTSSFVRLTEVRLR